ncbi:conserved hypothetical protein [Azospirillaceae bacterium]
MAPDVTAPQPTDVGGVSAGQLRSFVERIERLAEEIKGLQDDQKDIYSEAKGMGFEVKIIRKIVSLRKKSREERAEEEEMLTLYLQALGEL